MTTTFRDLLEVQCPGETRTDWTEDTELEFLFGIGGKGGELKCATLQIGKLIENHPEVLDMHVFSYGRRNVYLMQ